MHNLKTDLCGHHLSDREARNLAPRTGRGEILGTRLGDAWRATKGIFFKASNVVILKTNIV